MNRIERLQAILIQLQSKKIVRAQEIADRFEISLRTVYRDIRSLEESGVPIGSEVGVGYFLSEYYSLPPVGFTPSEANALVMAEKLMTQQGDLYMREQCQSALLKIKSVLQSKEKERIEELQSRIKFISPKPIQCEKNYLDTIQKALSEQLICTISYKKFGTSSCSTREIEPIGICNYGSAWHLIAWCCLRQDYRDFRVDRIHELTLTKRKSEQHITIEEYLDRYKNTEEQPNIQLQIPEEQTMWIENTKHWWGFLFQTQEKNITTLYFYYPNLEMFAGWLLGTGCMATIVSPQPLLDIVLRYIKQTQENYTLHHSTNV